MKTVNVYASNLTNRLRTTRCSISPTNFWNRFPKSIQLLLGVFVFLTVGLQTNAQVAAWDFAGKLGNEVTVAATTLNANLNGTNVSRGAGINPTGGADTYAANGFNVGGTLANAIASGDFFQFTINPKPAFKTSLSTLDANFRRSGTGPNMFQWQYSLDGFTTAGVDIGGPISYALTTLNGDVQAQIDLSTITALQNVVNSTTISFRLYGWGATNSSGTFALGRPASPLNDLAVGGTVAPLTVHNITQSIDYVFIQDAINAANSGDVIKADASTYNEILTINKNLVFRGDAAGIAGTGVRPAESILLAPTSGSNRLINLVGAVSVEFDGFLIDGKNIVAVTQPSQTLTLKNNLVELDFSDNDNNIYFSSNQLTLDRNFFKAITGTNTTGASSHIFMSGGSFTCTNNKFTSVNAIGSYTVSTTSLPVWLNVTTGTTGAAINNNLFDKVDIGILLADNAGGVVIENNDFNEAKRAAYTGGTSYGTGIAIFNTVTPASPDVIRNNNFTNSETGIRSSSTGPGQSFPAPNLLAASFNSFTNISVAAIRISSDFSGSANALKATCNWYSNITGPNIATNNGASGLVIIAPTNKVTYANWLNYGTDANPAALGFQLPSSVSAVPGANTSIAQNPYRVLSNAVGCLVSNQTLNLSGTFNFGLGFALTEWAKGNNQIAGDGMAVITGSGDDYSITAPASVTGVTITAASLGAALITGPGDLPAVSLESALYFNDNTATSSFQNWTISNLIFRDFDGSLIQDYNGGTTTAFNNFKIINNQFDIPEDLNATFGGESAVDLQNIGVHLSFGANQEVSGNIFNVDGIGISDDGAGKYSSISVIQSNTSGGAVYDGLKIKNNTINVLGDPDPVAPAVIRGIWENGQNTNAAIEISGNTFSNASAGNTANLNRQTAFWVTSRSGSVKKVQYKNNEVSRFKEGLAWLGGLYTGNTAPLYQTGEFPVEVKNNKFDATLNAVTVRKAAGSTNAGSPGYLENNSFTNFVPGGLAVKNEGTGNAQSVCNWYGTVSLPAITALNNGPVYLASYLSSGVDGNPATGFQPTGSCVLPPVHNETQNIYYVTIQSAIDDANTNDIIAVIAGTYPENVIVNKSVTLKGPNDGISPCSGSRVAEAVVVPATNAVGSGEIFHVTASNVKIYGFTIDGDNTALTSGVTNSIGADMNAAEGVTVYVDNINNLDVQNNIFQNLSYFGVTLFGASYSAPSTAGHIVSNNKFQHLGTYNDPEPNPGLNINRWGGGVLLYNNQYAAVNNNCMNDVRLGVQTGNYSTANPGAAATIDNNSMTNVRRSGIFHNLAYAAASPITLTGNTITGTANVNETKWDGISLASLSVPSSATGNIITATAVTQPSSGIQVWNVKSTSPTAISGGSVTGATTGVFVNNYDGYASDAADGAHAAISAITINTPAGGTGIRLFDNPLATSNANVQASLGAGVIINNGLNGLVVENSTASVTAFGNVAFTGQTGNYIKLIDNANNIDATTASFGGVTGAGASLAQNFAIEDKIVHKIDNGALGFVLVKANHDFVTANSFIAPATTTPKIQRGVDAASNGFIVNVAAGTYADDVIVDKSVTILGPNGGIDPCSGSRVAEAIVVPATNAVESGEIFHVAASNVTIDGFTIDGNNPGLTSGVTNTIGSDMNAAEGVTNYETGVSNLTVTNNIIQNLSYFAVTLYGNGGAATGGSIISNNKIQNLGTYNDPAPPATNINFWGGGVLLYNNQYASVTNNCMTNVRIGLQTGNFYQANPGAPGAISGNTISARRRGIFHNLAYTSASPYTLSGNTITGVADVNETGAWDGILVSSMGTGIASTISANGINGSAITAPIPTTGISVWNDQQAPLITGGTITGVKLGINVNNFEGYPTAGSNAGNTTATIDGVTVTGATVAGIQVNDNPSNTNNATVSAELRNNTISGSPAGILVSGSDAGANVHDNPSVTGNVIGLNINGGAVNPLYRNNINTNGTGVRNNGTLAVTTENFITNNTSEGIRIEATATATANINSNDLSGNTGFAINNLSAPTIAASCNWFGSVVYATVAAKVNGPVNYLNFLIIGTDNAPATPGFQPAPGACTGLGPVLNTNTGQSYFTIQAAINDPATLNGHTITASSGTYNEQVLVNKSVTINGIGATQPVVDFTGTVTGKPTLFDVSVDGVTINNFHFNTDLSKLKSAVIVSGASIDNITITNNVIDAYGTPSGGTYGDRNAVSVNYSGSTNYRVATGGVNSIIFTGNTVNGSGPASYFRSGISADEAGGTFTGNTLQTINHDVLVRFGSNGPVTISNNNFNGGGVEVADQNAAAGTFTISNNIFTPTGNDPSTAVLRIKNNYNSIAHIVSGNTFNYNTWAVSLENMNSVTLNGNTFSSSTANAHAVVVNTKSITGNSSAIVQVPIGATMTNNNFNGTGTGLLFLNHDSDNDAYGTFTIGTAGNENNFANTLSSFVTFDGQTGSSDLSTFPDYATMIGTGGTKTTTMACWDQDINIQNNKMDVGAGLQLPVAMNFVQRTSLENKLTHKPDNACLGLLTYFLPVHNITQNTYYLTIQAGIAAAAANDVIECAEWTFNERVIIDKPLTLQGIDSASTIITGTGLAGTGNGITVNNGVTNVTIQKLTVKNFAGAGGNANAGIYAIGGNNNLVVDLVGILNNAGGSGFYANGPVNGVTITHVTSTGHTTGARGIVIWNGLKQNINISNNHVYGNNCCGIELQDGSASGVTMNNNNVHDNGDNGMSAVGLEGPGVNVVSGNTITNNGRFGMEIKNPNGSGAASGAGSIVISNNTVSRTNPIGAELRDIAGIAVYRRGLTGSNVDVPYGVQVNNNTVTGYTQPSSSDGFGIVVEGINHTVSTNTVNGNDVGIQRQAGHLPYPGDGDQSNLADQYFGRGNSPVSCGITLTGNILANTVNTRDVGNSFGTGIVVNTNTGRSYCSIQAAINDAATLNGHTITASAGTYNEDVVISKQLTILGAGYATTTVSGPIGGGGATFSVQSPGVIIDGFTITRDGNNVAQWNLALNSSGVSIQTSPNSAEVRNCNIVGNRTGIDINNSNGNNIHNNIIDNNRTGLVLRNQTNTTNVQENFITNNWTVGVLFLDGSGGTNSPLQQALTSTFNNNNISGNWYGDVVDRQSGGSLPAPGTNMKNFECNWYGAATAPTLANTNSTEPGYAAQIPVIYGGAAVPPGGQPNILGPASANIDVTQWLVNGTDNAPATTGFQPVPGSCTGAGPVINTRTNNTYLNIQAGINDAFTINGDTLLVAAGTYIENVTVTKSLTILGPNAAVDPCSGVRVAEAIVKPAAIALEPVTTGAIFRLGAPAVHLNVTIKGFTIDGNNAALGAGRTLNGIAVHTGAGIVNSIGSFDANPGGYDVTMNIQNNIIKNLERYGVLADGVTPAVALAGTIVSHNKIDNLPSGNVYGGGRGRGIAFEENHYGTASFNCISRVNVGWQDDNYYLASPGAGTIVSNNTISSYHRGIFHNLQYSGATNATISNNIIAAESGNNSGTDFGVEIASIQSTVGASVTGNNVTGKKYGILLWNNPTSSTINVVGGVLTNNATGIYVTNDDPQFGAAASSNYVIDAVSIQNSTNNGIWVNDNSTATVSAEIKNNTINGGAAAAGILVKGSDASASIHNNAATITGALVGIDIDGGSVNPLYRNTITLNGTGVKVRNAGTLGVTTENFITAHTSEGIRIEATAGAIGAINNNDLSGTTGFAINNLSAPTLAASCNWYGSAVYATVAAKVNGPANYLNFLNNGTDNAPVTDGFQPVPGSCTGVGPVLNTNTGQSYFTITSAINDPITLTGHTITVAAGTYAEDVIVNKSLTILGPNAAIDPCSGVRVAEAIVVPATNAVGSGEIFHVAASNVTISGFTIDGDNTLLTSGVTNTTGADMNAAEGVTNYENGVNNLTVTNNIIQNVSYFGVTLYGSGSGAATSGSTISNNKIQNLGTYNDPAPPATNINFWGGAVLLYNNQYAAVNNNCMTNVRIGIQTGNFSQANPGAAASQLISGNTIEARRRGIFHNLFYSTASAYTLSNNTITGMANGNETAVWDGILLSSLSGAVHTASNNSINGSAVIVPATTGISVWNDQVAPLISGGTITGVQLGINVNNFEGYPTAGSNAGNTSATIDGVTVTGATTAGIRVNDNVLNTNNATVSAEIKGNTNVSGSPVGILVSGSDASANVHDNSSTITGNVIGVDANGGTVNPLYRNTISANGTGVRVTAGAVLGLTSENFITNNTTEGIRIEATAGTIGNINNNDLSGNTGLAINKLSASTVNAECNWFGSTIPALVSAKVSANVDVIPWLTTGTDNAPGTAGFQPVPGSCNGAGPVLNTNTNQTYFTIQSAINDPLTLNGHTIQVLAGTYTENVVVNKSLTILGPNEAIDPCSGVRVPEAIIIPATGPATTGNATTTIMDVIASNVTIRGFTLNGDNPALASAFQANGADIDVDMGISASASATGNNISVKHNIIKNVFQFGVSLGSTGGPSKSGEVSHNKIDNVPYWAGVLVYDDYYADISNNCINNAWMGVQVDNYYQAKPSGATAAIQSNTITTQTQVITGDATYTDVHGIRINNVYQNTSTWTVANNTVTNTTAVSAGSTGLELWSVQNAVAVAVSGSTVDGFESGYYLWNCPTTSTVNISGSATNCTNGVLATNKTSGYGSANSTYLLSNLTLTNCTNGVKVFDDPAALPIQQTTVAVNITTGVNITGGTNGLLIENTRASLPNAGSVTLSGQSGSYIKLINNANNVLATSASFAGQTGATASLPQNFAIEDKIVHKIDDGALGFVLVKANHDFVTANSFIIPATTAAKIQRGVDAASTGFTVNVDAGTYADNVVVNKSVMILGPNGVIDPCSGSRVAEAIVVPATAAIASGEIFHVAASNVTISGFTINGDNTAITSGFSSTNGADIDAAEGITVYETGVNNLTVTNNIIKNLSYFGVTLYDYPAGVPSTGHVIANNRIQDMGTYDPASTIELWGGGVLLYNNQYAAVTNNCMTNVRIGLQTGNFYGANPGLAASQVISGNSIQARRRGIFHNLAYSSASPFTISGNSITGLANANETASWDGMLVASMGTGIASTISNNTINGAAVTAIPTTGISVWNDQAAPLISGGTISGVGLGINVNNFEGYPSTGSNAGNTTATIDGVTVTGATIAGIRVNDNPLNTNGATVSAEIRNNNISAGAAGILVAGSDATANVHDNIASVTGNLVGVDINGGTVSPLYRNRISANGTGIRVRNSGVLGLTTENYITNNTTAGISIEATAGAIANINSNDISGNPAGFAINNLSVPTVNATCNWWGVTGGNALVTAVGGAGTSYAPWLHSGVDAQPGTNGFQPGGICGYDNDLYVNDGSNTGNFYTSAVGNDINPGVPAAPFRTIGKAITVALPTGNTVWVDAGNYPENLVVNKELTFKGRNAGLNVTPRFGAFTGLKASTDLESVVTAPVSNPLNNPNDLVKVLSNNITFDGFTFDGNNPAIAGVSAVVDNLGLDIDSRRAFTNIDAANGFNPVNNLVIKNNIMQNVAQRGVSLANNGPLSTGNLIDSNLIRNFGWDPVNGGQGVILFTNAYADVTHNTIDVPHDQIGLHLQNFFSNGTMTWSNNNVTVGQDAIGIHANLFYAPAGVLNLQNNTVNARAGVTGASDYSWGINIWSVQSGSTVNVTNNTVGNTGGELARGINLWNLPTGNTVTVSGGVVGKSIVGINLDNVDPYFGVGSNTMVNITGNATVTAVSGQTGIRARSATVNAVAPGGAVTLNLNNATVLTSGSGIGVSVDAASANTSNMATVYLAGGTTISGGSNTPVSVNGDQAQLYAGTAAITAPATGANNAIQFSGITAANSRENLVIAGGTTIGMNANTAARAFASPQYSIVEMDAASGWAVPSKIAGGLQTVLIDGKVKFSNGVLSTAAADTIEFGNNAADILAGANPEKAGSYILGNAKMLSRAVNNGAVDMLGTVLAAEAGAPANMGNLVISRTTSVAGSINPLFPANQSIRTVWNITPSNITASRTNVRFRYLNIAGNINGQTPASIYSYRYTGGVWQKISASLSSALVGDVLTTTAFNAPSFSPWTLSSQATPTQADLTPLVNIDGASFNLAQVGVNRDFIVSLEEVANVTTAGTITFRIAKPSVFDISFVPGNGISNVFGGTPNTNGDFTFTDMGAFYEVTTTVPIGASSNKIAGFRIKRKPGFPANTSESISIGIVAGSGGDNTNGNNSTSLQVTAN